MNKPKFEQKVNTGVLWDRRDEKEAPTHSDFGGDLNVDGQGFWINAWAKKDKNGKTFFSLTVKAKDSRKTVDQALKQVRQGGHAPSNVDDDLDQDIPW